MTDKDYLTQTFSSKILFAPLGEVQLKAIGEALGLIRNDDYAFLVKNTRAGLKKPSNNERRKRLRFKETGYYLG